VEAQFWLNKWQKNETGFHLSKPHPWLVTHWPELYPNTGPCHVFVPLCGKSLDLDFFYQQGHHVTANELSEEAIKAVFERLQLTPKISTWAGGVCYRAERLSVYVGDFFLLSQTDVSDVDWVYDRAALIALPQDMRQHYTHKIMQLCPKASQCLITLDYQQALMSGPPFALSDAEVREHYQATYAIEELKSANIIQHEPRFEQNGLPELFQRLYRLTPK
jgi:thiopurine S-methyltransferase